MKKIVILILMNVFSLQLCSAQDLPDGQKRWSATDKLTREDFKIKISDRNNDVAYSQFMISHSITAFDFLKRNLNKKIENIFLGNASWIDTTRVQDIQKQIEFQQMQFDLAEIAARKFRKRMLEEKGRVVKNLDIVNQISNEIMAELSERRLWFIKTTEGGLNAEKMEEWKQKISEELKELYEFRFENNKKIKLSE